MEDLNSKIIRYAHDSSCSDIHIHGNAELALRVHGHIEHFRADKISHQAVDIFAKQHLDSNLLQRLEQNRSLDTNIQCGETHFRANFYYTCDQLAVVLRRISQHIPSMQTLGIPEQIKSRLNLGGGLILLSGPTGSGKSTSLAAMTQHLLEEQSIHVITIEDPVEYRFHAEHSIVSQRQVGTDTPSFAAALYAALREDPDVILLGEMRTPETIALALIAAELGHLVMATLHAGNCRDAVARIVNAFGVSANDAEHVRMQLADSLSLVISQRLLLCKGKPGRVACFEVLCATTAVRNSIRSNQIFHLPSILETSQSEGMITMQAFAKQLYAQGMIEHVET